jgi:hypothetical protein
MAVSAGAEAGVGEDDRSPPKCASIEAHTALARPAPMISTNFTKKREK